MGTRNLTCIIKDNEFKLAQYGQWDGYFSYSGVKFLQFVKEHLQNKSKKRRQYFKEKFEEKVNALAPVSKEYLEVIQKTHDKFSSSSNKNETNFAIPLNLMFPQFSRDTGVKILDIIYKLEPYELNGKKFPVFVDTSTDWVEFINILDLDNDKVYMLTYHEFKCEPLETSDLVSKTFPMPCWYACNIQDIPTIKEVEKYKESIELDIWVDDNGEKHSN